MKLNKWKDSRAKVRGPIWQIVVDQIYSNLNSKYNMEHSDWIFIREATTTRFAVFLGVLEKSNEV